MDQKPAIFSFILMIAAIVASPAAAQTRSVNDQLCDQVSIKEAAAKMTRDWSERFQQNGVEQAVQKWLGWYRKSYGRRKRWDSLPNFV